MIGYKATDSEGCCRGFQYEAGKEYALPKGEKTELCVKGFHFCQDLHSVYAFYPSRFNRVFRVESEGGYRASNNDSKVATGRLHVLHELTREERREILLKEMECKWRGLDCPGWDAAFRHPDCAGEILEPVLRKEGDDRKYWQRSASRSPYLSEEQQEQLFSLLSGERLFCEPLLKNNFLSLPMRRKIFLALLEGKRQMFGETGTSHAFMCNVSHPPEFLREIWESFLGAEIPERQKYVVAESLLQHPQTPEDILLEALDLFERSVKQPHLGGDPLTEFVSEAVLRKAERILSSDKHSGFLFRHRNASESFRKELLLRYAKDPWFLGKIAKDLRREETELILSLNPSAARTLLHDGCGTLPVKTVEGLLQPEVTFSEAWPTLRQYQDLSPELLVDLARGQYPTNLYAHPGLKGKTLRELASSEDPPMGLAANPNLTVEELGRFIRLAKKWNGKWLRRQICRNPKLGKWFPKEMRRLAKRQAEGDTFLSECLSSNPSLTRKSAEMLIAASVYDTKRLLLNPGLPQDLHERVLHQRGCVWAELKSFDFRLIGSRCQEYLARNGVPFWRKALADWEGTSPEILQILAEDQEYWVRKTAKERLLEEEEDAYRL
jgi:hypothetical protein